jgi:hypothetical protein
MLSPSSGYTHKTSHISLQAHINQLLRSSDASTREPDLWPDVSTFSCNSDTVQCRDFPDDKCPLHVSVPLHNWLAPVGGRLNSESSRISTFLFLYAIVTSPFPRRPRTLYRQHRRQSIASSSVSPPTLVNAVWRNVFRAEELKSFTFWLQPTRIGDSQNRVRHGDIFCFFYLFEGTRWRSWLRHWTSSRKLAVSIPDRVIDIILLAALNPWGRLSL